MFTKHRVFQRLVKDNTAVLHVEDAWEPVGKEDTSGKEHVLTEWSGSWLQISREEKRKWKSDQPPTKCEYIAKKERNQ